jgi:hypothetical protein
VSEVIEILILGLTDTLEGKLVESNLLNTENYGKGEFFLFLLTDYSIEKVVVLDYDFRILQCV